MTRFDSSRLACGVVLAVAFAALPAWAQDADQDADMAVALKALDDALPGELIHNPLDLEWSPRGENVKTKIVDANALTSGQAISARNKKRQAKAWDSVLGVDIPGEIKTGEKVQIYYWARTAKPPKGADTADAAIFLGRKVEPYDHLVAGPVTLGEEWELQSMTGTASADFPADSLKMEYHLGNEAQTIEVGPLYVSKL